MNFLDIIIQTDRLRLVPVSMEFVNEMYEELTDEIAKYLSFYPPESLDQEVKFVEKSRKDMKDKDAIVLSVLDKKTGEYLGNVSLNGIKKKAPEMGIWIKKSAHGKRIGREAAIGLKDWAFKNLELDHIFYTMNVENMPSKKIAEALGGKFIKTEERNFPSGKVQLNHFYHVLPE